MQFPSLLPPSGQPRLLSNRSLLRYESHASNDNDSGNGNSEHFNDEFYGPGGFEEIVHDVGQGVFDSQFTADNRPVSSIPLSISGSRTVSRRNPSPEASHYCNRTGFPSADFI